MNKVTVSSITDEGVPSFASTAYSPDNSQNARRLFTALSSTEFISGISVAVTELTAPADKTGGAVKALCRVRYGVPQLKLASSLGSGFASAGLQQTGQTDFVQATLTLTLPAMYAKILLKQTPASAGLVLQVQALARAAVLDTLSGIFSDFKPGSAFDASAWTSPFAPTQPLLRACQGANPEDVFNGSYGATA